MAKGADVNMRRFDFVTSLHMAVQVRSKLVSFKLLKSFQGRY